MRLTDSIIIFTICVGFGLSVVSSLGIGGDKLTAMDFWNDLFLKATIIVTVGIAAILAGMLTSGGSIWPVTLPDKLGEAAAIGILEGAFGVFAWTLSDFVWEIDYIGPVLGGFLAIFFGIVLILDVVDRVTSLGG